MHQVQAEPGSILVITSSDADLYTRFSASFKLQYKSLAGKSGARINSIRLNENGQLSGPVPTDTTLIVSVGAKTAHAVKALILTTPVLYALIPESTYQSLTPATASCARQSAIFIDQPVARQAHLAQAIFHTVPQAGDELLAERPHVGPLPGGCFSIIRIWRNLMTVSLQKFAMSR